MVHVAFVLWLFALEFCNAADLAGHCSLDENRGTVAGDLAGDYDGVLHGCTWQPGTYNSV